MRTDAKEHALRGRGVKLTNPLAKALEHDLDETPKAVLAAIAVSLLRTAQGQPIRDVDHASEAFRREVRTGIRAEWVALWHAGLLPQEPPKLEAQT